MRVILREDLDNLGTAGEVVTVRDGYGRNYLLPRGLAALATEKDVTRLEHERRVIASRNATNSCQVSSIGQTRSASPCSISMGAVIRSTWRIGDAAARPSSCS